MLGMISTDFVWNPLSMLIFDVEAGAAKVLLATPPQLLHCFSEEILLTGMI